MCPSDIHKVPFVTKIIICLNFPSINSINDLKILKEIKENNSNLPNNLMSLCFAKYIVMHIINSLKNLKGNFF